LHNQVSNLTTQLEQAEKRLEQERSARQALEGSRDDKIKAVESSWNEVLKEKQDNWEAKEKALEEKVEHQDRLIKEIKASYEVSQRLSKDDDSAQASQRGATAAELEIVSLELDRSNMRLAEVEARNEQLRLELAQSASQSETSRSGPVEDDPAFLRLQSENSSLLRKVESGRLEKDSEKRKWEASVRTLEREVNTLKKDRDTVKAKLSQWADYDNIKQELEVLKVRCTFQGTPNDC
jgi:homeobox protein cut-like